MVGEWIHHGSVMLPPSPVVVALAVPVVVCLSLSRLAARLFVAWLPRECCS
jgi:hypothetical protein